MIKYKADTSFNTIKPAEVARETQKQVVLKNGRKESKSTAYYSYFDEWQHAKDYLVGVAQSKVAGCRSSLEHAKSKLGNAKGLKQPKET